MLWLTLMACPKMDAEPWRMDIKEQQVLYTAAEEYWLGVRWGELGRSSKYIEDPLERARFLNSYIPGQYIDIKVLHANLEPLAEDFEITPDTKIWRTGTVYVQIEQVINGHKLHNSEEQQEWYRTSTGWYIDTE